MKWNKGFFIEDFLISIITVILFVIVAFITISVFHDYHKRIEISQESIQYEGSN